MLTVSGLCQISFRSCLMHDNYIDKDYH